LVGTPIIDRWLSTGLELGEKSATGDSGGRSTEGASIKAPQAPKLWMRRGVSFHIETTLGRDCWPTSAFFSI